MQTGSPQILRHQHSCAGLPCRAGLPLCRFHSIQHRRTGQGRWQGRRGLSVQALKEGEKLQDNPDYYRVLKQSDGGGLALSNFAKKQPVVLFFYPQAGTPGCTKQAASFRDAYDKFKAKGVAVYGISSDSPEKNKEFAQAQKLPFPLLTDQGDFLRKSFDIKADAFGLLKGRQTFVIAKDGTCVFTYRDQLGAEKHVQEALKAIAKL